jgi:hypothetical protein
MRGVLGSVLVGMTLFGASCAEATVSGPSAVGNNASLTIQTFEGALPLGAFRFYSFTVLRPGLISVTLLGLKQGGADTTTPVLLGLGSPRGTDCAPIDARLTAADVVPQLTLQSNPGVYCARISDSGQLAGPVDFSINIVYPR